MVNNHVCICGYMSMCMCVIEINDHRFLGELLCLRTKVGNLQMCT